MCNGGMVLPGALWGQEVGARAECCCPGPRPGREYSLLGTHCCSSQSSWAAGTSSLTKQGPVQPAPLRGHQGPEWGRVVVVTVKPVASAGACSLVTAEGPVLLSESK